MSLLTCATSSTPQMSKLAGPWYVHCTQKNQIIFSLQLTADKDNHCKRRNVKETKPNEYSLTLHIICTIIRKLFVPGATTETSRGNKTKWYRNEIYPNNISSKLFSSFFPWEKCKQRNGNMFTIDKNKVHTREIINYIKWNQDVKIHEQIRNIIC